MLAFPCHTAVTGKGGGLGVHAGKPTREKEIGVNRTLQAGHVTGNISTSKHLPQILGTTWWGTKMRRRRKRPKLTNVRRHRDCTLHLEVRIRLTPGLPISWFMRCFEAVNC
jgi:hypothetical protein